MYYLKKFKICFKPLLMSHNFALITTNNVTDDFKKGGIIPRLGPTWSDDLHFQYELIRPNNS